MERRGDKARKGLGATGGKHYVQFGCAEIGLKLPVKPRFSHCMWPRRLFSRVWPYRPGDTKSRVWDWKRNHYAKKKIPNIKTNDTVQHQIKRCQMKQHT